MLKDKEFYNKESDKYSLKRYPMKAVDYIQFFFKKRMDIALKNTKTFFEKKEGLSLLEIGCADGVVLREVVSKMDSLFSSIIGIDIAEKMVEKARELNSSPKTSYYVRGNESEDKKFDLVFELGVINYTDFENDIEYAANHLNEGGLYLMSVAGRGSFNNLFRQGGDQYQNFLTYTEYENIIKKYFIIRKITPCGLYIPTIWRVPVLALLLQPVFEKMFFFLPNLYHEKIYTLIKK